MPYGGQTSDNLQDRLDRDKEFKKKYDARKIIRKEGNEGETGNAPHYHDQALEKLYRNMCDYTVLPDTYSLGKNEVRAIFDALKNIFG